MSKWKCDICNTEFENFEARGFNNTIYCPLCYYKKLYKQQKEVIDKARIYIKEHSTTIDYKTMKADYNLNMNDLLDILEGDNK